MIGTKNIPNREDLVEYAYAVAGHEGTLCDTDGELFIKPCTQQEIDFYQSANEEHPEFAELMPLFMGTLLLNDATDVTSIDEQIPVIAEHLSREAKEEVIEYAHHLHPHPHPHLQPQFPPQPQPQPNAGNAPASALAAAAAAAEATAAGNKPPRPASDNVTWVPNRTKKIATDRAIVLENASYGYKRPNILDVKLGVRLWSDDAPLQKKQRFDQISAETTHGELGFRIAGMRVYRGSQRAEDLDDEGYRIYDKDYGRVHVNRANVVEAFRRFIFNDAARIDEELGRAVAHAFLEDLKRVRRVLEREESRMYSASLLFVFEGDGEALRAAVEETSASATMSQQGVGEKRGREATAAATAALTTPSTARVDSGIALEDADGSGDESDEADVPRIYALKLIDFAHAEWTPGLGPDENALTGVRSLIRIFEELSS